MRIALVASDYLPMRTSAAVQLNDLSQEFAKKGNEVFVMVPSDSLNCNTITDFHNGINIIHFPAMRIKDTNYFMRAIAEIFLPLFMLHGFNKSVYRSVKFDLIVWYSPSIFFGPFIAYLKHKSKCRSYLILRDIFPEWALNLGLIKKGLPYYLFKFFEFYQYKVADVIGVQSRSNLKYISKWKSLDCRLEVLDNWLAQASNLGCSISIESTSLSGRTIFVYAGNMGIAQNVDDILEVAIKLERRVDIGFIFVGRGTQSSALQAKAKSMRLTNVLFFDEINTYEIPGLLAQCHIGLIALDLRHKTHNIPGKLLSYLQAGLPILARVNSDSDLAAIIYEENIGLVCDETIDELKNVAEDLTNNIEKRISMSKRCKVLSHTLFSPEKTAQQILEVFFINS